MARITEWHKLPVSLTELCLATTLRCGQSFRWKQGQDNTWACSLRGRVIQLSQDSSHLSYRSIWPAEQPLTPPSSVAATPAEAIDDTQPLIEHYLNLQPNLGALYKQWSAADPNFRKKAPRFTGVRILRQDAWEALVGFICSSNNNISRISQMVEKLCTHYGPYLATVEGRAYHDFPSPGSLTGPDVEAHLRELGFGYRAKYIAQTARMVVHDRESGWLDSLRNPECPALGRTASPAGPMQPAGRDGYRTAHEMLLTLQGVGPKVADCVCLMGLGWGEAVPVDTHVWQIAQRDYKFGRGKHSSLTKATYDAVANHFRQLWGQDAGWAHSVLFTADLRSFSEQLSAKVEIQAESIDPVEQKLTTVAKKITVKRELSAIDATSVVEVHETRMTSSERVKRRRRG